MERKKWIYSIVLILLSAAYSLLTGCSGSIEHLSKETISIRFSTETPVCRSFDPEENKINDISLWVFDQYGNLEEQVQLEQGHGRT